MQAAQGDQIQRCKHHRTDRSKLMLECCSWIFHMGMCCSFGHSRFSELIRLCSRQHFVALSSWLKLRSSCTSELSRRQDLSFLLWFCARYEHYKKGALWPDDFLMFLSAFCKPMCFFDALKSNSTSWRSPSSSSNPAVVNTLFWV